MTSLQKKLVRETFGELLPLAPQAAALFYGRLFEIAPGLRPLFKGDLASQGKKLFEMLGACVSQLDDPDVLLPKVRDLGRRHVAYGVKEADYDQVGTALLWTLQAGLAAAYTPEVQDAWTAVYQILAATMQEGARSARA
jgi:hemoglobin-like flavoprotein